MSEKWQIDECMPAYIILYRYFPRHSKIVHIIMCFLHTHISALIYYYHGVCGEEEKGDDAEYIRESRSKKRRDRKNVMTIISTCVWRLFS